MFISISMQQLKFSFFFIIQMDVKNDLLSSVLDLHVLSLRFPIYGIKLLIIIPKPTFLTLSSYIYIFPSVKIFLVLKDYIK